MPFQYDVIIFVYVDKSDFIEPTFANNFDISMQIDMNFIRGNKHEY